MTSALIRDPGSWSRTGWMVLLSRILIAIHIVTGGRRAAARGGSAFRAKIRTTFISEMDALNINTDLLLGFPTSPRTIITMKVKSINSSLGHTHIHVDNGQSKQYKEELMMGSDKFNKAVFDWFPSFVLVYD